MAGVVLPVEESRRFLADLFNGPFRGHAFIFEPEWRERDWTDGDVAVSDRPVKEWMPSLVGLYEARLKLHEALDDDSVPYASVKTGTELFASAFGCSTHVYENDVPCALPAITTVEEADRLPLPDLNSRPFARVFEAGHLLRDRLGSDVPIGIPDIQSPFDIAALVWRKQDILIAMIEQPDAVHRLVEKCTILLKSFISEFPRQFPNCNLCHCPMAYAPG